MQSYRLSTNLKLGLFVSALLIAVASLAYSSRLVNQLREREQLVIRLWADALVEVSRSQGQAENPYLGTLLDMTAYWQRLEGADGDRLSESQLQAFREATYWAQSMPPIGELNVITNILIFRNAFEIPSIIWDDENGPVGWIDVPVDSLLPTAADTAAARAALAELMKEMDASYEPIPIHASSDSLGAFQQFVHYGESRLVRELRLFPYVQIVFVSLFVLVGYLGFSYVRRSEQKGLWVGMAKEAAHQLGTPISSLMGWIELLRDADLPEDQEASALMEVEKDVQRLQRVANRFSNIGSRPHLETLRLAPVIQGVADYMRRRFPQRGKHVGLSVVVPSDVKAPLNAELFEWVIENLLKNALDAIETEKGEIEIVVTEQDRHVCIDVRDTGKGIDRREWKNVFRPGYSTKKRGWGLGLSLAKRIVEDYHGGSMAVAQSRPGAGTTFRIRLPTEPESPQDA